MSEAMVRRLYRWLGAAMMLCLFASLALGAVATFLPFDAARGPALVLALLAIVLFVIVDRLEKMVSLLDIDLYVEALRQCSSRPEAGR
jgi:uncharacterized membrane protein (DUF106 family)